MFVPIWKLSCFAQAFIIVSCTRSSALSWRPLKETAKARSDGSVARSSRLKEGVSSKSVDLTFAGLFDLVQFLKQIQELVWDGLILNCTVERPKFSPDIRVRAKSVFGAPRPRYAHLIHFRFVFHYPNL